MALPGTTRERLRELLFIPKTGQVEVSTTGGEASVLVSDGVTVKDLEVVTKEVLMKFLVADDAEFPVLWVAAVQKADATLSQVKEPIKVDVNKEQTEAKVTIKATENPTEEVVTIKATVEGFNGIVGSTGDISVDSGDNVRETKLGTGDSAVKNNEDAKPTKKNSKK